MVRSWRARRRAVPAAMARARHNLRMCIIVWLPHPAPHSVDGLSISLKVVHDLQTNLLRLLRDTIALVQPVRRLLQSGGGVQQLRPLHQRGGGGGRDCCIMKMTCTVIIMHTQTRTRTHTEIIITEWLRGNTVHTLCVYSMPIVYRCTCKQAAYVGISMGFLLHTLSHSKQNSNYS